MRFSTVVELHGRSATGLPVPAEVLAGLDAGKRPAVTVTLRGYSYRTTVASMGGRTLVPQEAKRAETRSARIERTVQGLREGRKTH